MDSDTPTKPVTQADLLARLDTQPETLCAWCLDAAEKLAAATRRGALVSHGICPACKASWRKEIGRGAQEAARELGRTA